MGILDRWRKTTAQATASTSAPSAPTAPRTPTPRPDQSQRRAVQQLTRQAQWVGPDTSLDIAGHTLPGGMLYVGRGLRAPSGATEPALIDPTLRIDPRRPDHHGATMGYWPSYDSITPAARAAYLSWLTSGRRNPNVAVGYVFLFFYGLERRVLVDIANDATLSWELPALRRELARLLDLYDRNGSFGSYGRNLLGVIDLIAAQDNNADPTEATAPVLAWDYRWQTPPRLLTGLGALAEKGLPIPPSWALAWACYHPDMRLRRSANRCEEEFAALFKARYTTAHGDGFVVHPGRSKIRVDYRAASAGIQGAKIDTGLPDVFTQTAPARKLIALADQAMTDLDPYSRYLGRNPDGRGTAAAAALLPVELLGEPTGELRDLRDWATAQAFGRTATTGAELLARWPTKSPERMAKPETVALAQLLEHFGLGIEPDVRFSGPAITPTTPVVVFTNHPQPPRTATAAYASATTLLHLAVAVSAADGHTSEAELAHLVDHLETALSLSDGERVRLEAHMRWLAANTIKLSGLTRRIETLDSAQRDAVAGLLVAVAAADGIISPDEVTSLTKIFKLLGLDPAQVHSRLHAHLTGVRPAAGPVTVRPAGTPDAGYPIHEPADTHAVVAQQDGTPGGAVVALDLAAIEAKFAETAEVSALLTDIFTDDDQPGIPPAPISGGAVAATQEPAVPPPAPNDAVEAPLIGLDTTHSTLLRSLAERDAWTRSEFEALVAEFDLMPEGALDRLNEAALDAVDEPFLDEDDPDTLTVNAYARQEIFS